jgi:nucleoside-diphosphate-sugar epimerase
VRRAVVIGGAGTVGRAVARQLLADGWLVDVVGRDPEHLPADLRDGGAGFVMADRADDSALRVALAPGADLVVDCACFTAAHARGLAALLADVGSAVLISSKAVYVDDVGNHSNSPVAPAFTGPVTESQPTLHPDPSDEYASATGYGPCKVAAENVLLDSGYPVTVLRPSKVHGDGALRPNEWAIVSRVLDGRDVLALAHRGESGDHTSAAVNLAALVRTVAERPGRRVLNAADPDAPTTLEISRIIAEHFQHHFTETLLDHDADPTLGRTPWNRWPPVRLDVSAATALGYRPVGDYRATVASTLEWLRDIAVPTPTGFRLPDEYENDYFDELIG